MNGWPAGSGLPEAGLFAIYRGVEYRTSRILDRPVVRLYLTDRVGAPIDPADVISRSRTDDPRPWVEVPLTSVDRLFDIGCRATWSGLEVGVGTHGPDDVTIYHERHPSLAAGLGMIGSQYEGFHLEVPLSEVQEIVVSEEELDLWHRGLLRPWPRGTDLPRVGLLALLRGREFFAGIHPHNPIVHLLMSATDLGAFSDPAEISRDKPRSAAPRATVARRSVDRLFTRRIDATWNGTPVGVRPHDPRTVTIYYDADPTVHMVPGMAGSRDTEIYNYVTLSELRDIRITEKDIPLWHAELEAQPR
ncbi:hypothetical protein [Cellulomonas soli]